MNLLPPEMSLEIFSYLNTAELGRCLQVSRTWNVLASDEALWKVLLLREIVFGKKQWETYFGEIGKEPPLPKDIYEILNSPCPIFLGKKVRETHMLVLIPETVNGKPLNLTTLGELVKVPKEGHATQYRNILDEILNDEHANQATTQPHWVLMTMDVIPESRNESYLDQHDLITELVKQTGINYEVPNVLDEVICIFMHHIGDGKRLFADKPWTYTRCQENVQSYQIIVGGFSLAGLDVNSLNFVSGLIGVAALRKFF